MKVRIRLAGGSEHSVEGDYGELSSHLLPALRKVGSFDRDGLFWFVKWQIDGWAADALRRYGVPVDEHNAALRAELERRARGTTRIYPLRRLSDDEFRALSRVARWNRDGGYFELTASPAKAEPILSELPVVYDPEALRAARASVRIEGGEVVVSGPGSLALAEKFRVPYFRQVVRPEGDRYEVSTQQVELRLLRVAGAEVRGKLGLYPAVRAELGLPPRPPASRVELPGRGFELRDYQREALERWLARGFGTVVIPTGGGKTPVAIEAMRAIGAPTLVCVTTIELARQWIHVIRERLGVEAGLLGGGESDIRPVTVAIYNSAVSHLDEIRDRFYLHIYDEGHHVAAETFKEVALGAFSELRMVLSATPERYDGNHVLIYAAAGPPVFKITYRELASRGYVAPLVYSKLSGELTPSEREAYRAAPGGGDVRGVTTKKKVAGMAEWKYAALRSLLKEHGGNRILVFAEYVEQAERAYEVARGVLGDAAAMITGSTPAATRRAVFEAFKEGRVRCLVTTKVLDEGVDVPDADVAILMSNSGQPRQMIQRIGRVVRPREGKVARVYDMVTRDTIEYVLWRRRFAEAAPIFQLGNPAGATPRNADLTSFL